MSVQTYTYDGPEGLHALVGQVMASLGYVGAGKSATSGRPLPSAMTAATSI